MDTREQRMVNLCVALLSVDGGCSFCAYDVVQATVKAFPEINFRPYLEAAIASGRPQGHWGQDSIDGLLTPEKET